MDIDRDILPMTSSSRVRRARNFNVIEASQCQKYKEHLGKQMKRMQGVREREAAEIVQQMDKLWQTTGYFGRRHSSPRVGLPLPLSNEDGEDEEDEDEDREEGGGGEWGRHYMYGELVQQPPRRVSFSLVRSLSSRPPTSLACYPSTTPKASSRATSTPGTPARAHSPGLMTPMASSPGRRHSMPAYMTPRDSLMSNIAKTSRYFAARDTSGTGGSITAIDTNKLSLPKKFNKVSPALIIDRKNSISTQSPASPAAGGKREGKSRKTSVVSVATTDEYVNARSSPDSEGESADSSCTDTSEDEEVGEKSIRFSLTSLQQQQPESCAQQSGSRLSHVKFARSSALPVVSV